MTTELKEFLDEVMKPGNDNLCCTLNTYWQCALCKHPVCKEHLSASHFCVRCSTWLIARHNKRNGI